MMTVWKAVLGFNYHQFIMAPLGATILHVAEQAGAVCIWFQCDTDNDLVEHPIFMVPTGGDVPSPMHKYVGTVLLEGGQLVMHIYS